MKISAIMINPNKRRVKLINVRGTWPAIKETVRTVRIFQYRVLEQQLVTAYPSATNNDPIPGLALFAFRSMPKIHFSGPSVMIGLNMDEPESIPLSPVVVAEKIIFPGDPGFHCRTCAESKDILETGLCNDCAMSDLHASMNN